MPGPILFLIMVEGQEKPLAAIPNLGSYDAKTQLDALEAQAIAGNKMLILTATMADFPEDDEEEAEEGKDA